MHFLAYPSFIVVGSHQYHHPSFHDDLFPPGLRGLHQIQMQVLAYCDCSIEAELPGTAHLLLVHLEGVAILHFQLKSC